MIQPTPVLVLALLAFGVSDAGASALPDPAAAKAADKCQAAINKAGTKFVTQTLKAHEKCYDAVFKCIQTKPGDQKCLDKAIAKCAREVNDKRPKNEAKLLRSIGKKCASFNDLSSADGLGFEALGTTCTNAGFPLTSISAVSNCIRELTECDAERMFGAEMPRARGFADQEGIATRVGTCMLGTGLGDVGDPKGLGKALDKCQKQVKKASAKFVASKLKSLQKCVGAIFKCKQTKPGDAGCLAKAETRCDKEFNTKIPKAETKLAQALVKRCAEIFAGLGAADAMNIDVLGPTCLEVGVAPLATMNLYAECIVRRHACLVEDITAYLAPRAAGLLQEVGHVLTSDVCGPTPTPTVTPTPTLTVTPTPTLTPTPTPSFTPAPGQFAIIINKQGTGSGTVTSSPAGIDCGSTCGASFPPATAVKLEARTTNGANSQFNFWGGDSCTGPFWDCDVVTDQTHVADAWFGTLDHNLVFATSPATVVAKDLGGVAPYDAICNQVATAAGLNNLTDDAYMAFISSSVSNAVTRLGTARGFIRRDGKAFADLPADMVTREVFHPILFDETGLFEFSQDAIMTGTNQGGATASTCSDWTVADNTAFYTRGALRTGGAWTGVGILRCDFGSPRLACLMKTQTAAIVPPTPPPGSKVIYVSNSPLAIAGDDPDATCEADKPAGAGVVKAMLATTSTAASAHLDDATTYVRPDGYVVGTGAELVATAMGSGSGPFLPSGVWQRGNGSYVGGSVWAGNGQDIDAVGTVASTCNDWTDNGGTGDRGLLERIDFGWWVGVGGVSCATAAPIRCVEQ